MNDPMDISIFLHEWQHQTIVDEKGAAIPIILSQSDSILSDKLSSGGFLHVQDLKSGLNIQTTSYVGRLQLGPLQLHIRPKIEHLPLLSLFRYAYGLNKLHLFSSVVYHTEEFGIVELLVIQLLAEIKTLMQRGLSKRYVDQCRYLSRPRGHLDIPRLARDSFRQDSRIPCKIHPRLLDIPHNQCLRASLALAAVLTIDKQLAFQCRQLSSQLADKVSEHRLSKVFFDKVDQQHGRLLRHYEPAIIIGKLLAQSSGILLDSSAGEQSIPGVLLDMNRLYQSVLGRFLRENLSEFEVLEEHSLKGMFLYQPGFNPRRRRAPLPRPDFILRKGARTVEILDAKYRDLWEHALPREMLYQLGIYALAHPQVKGSTILYPTMNSSAGESRIAICEPVSGKRMSEVCLRPVYLPDLVKWIDAPQGIHTERGRHRFAMQMVLGDDTVSNIQMLRLAM